MQRLGRYEILAELGRGAMGTVYRARDPRIDRVVALKTIAVVGAGPAEAEEYRQRFFREAQAAGKLSHPGIVTLYDVGEDEPTQTPYLVMEYIEGHTLESLVAGAGTERLPLATTLNLARQVAEALDYAHAHSIVHRDIKPSNILVTPDGRAKITDFGIAKLALSQFTLPGQVLGTPSYMSPEQLSGGAVDGRSDLFSLGVILYWMLTGDKPFTGDTTTAISFKIVYKDPIPPSQLNPSLRREFDALLDRALAKDPALRYQRGCEFADDLEDLAAGRAPRSLARAAPGPAVERTVVRPPGPVLASPQPRLPAHQAPVPPPIVAPAPLATRRGWAVTLLVLLALLFGGAGGWWWFDRQAPPTAAQAPGQTTAAVERASAEPPKVSPPQDTPVRRTTTTASTRPATQQPTPTEQPKTADEPPSHAPAVGRRRQAESRPAPVAAATLNLRSEHNFRRADVYLWVEDELKYRGTLRGEERRYGVAKIYQGTFSASVGVTPGWHNIKVRVTSQEDEGFDQTREIQGEFGPGMERTLELYFGKAGFLGNVSRSLSLRWKN